MTIYLICFLIGVGFSAISLISMFGHGLHHTGHAGGHAAHGPVHGHSHGAHQQGQPQPHGQSQNTHNHHIASDFEQATTPLLMRLNIAALVIFLACFGGAGLIASLWTPPLVAAPIALAAGIAGSALINRVIRMFAGRETPLEAVTITGTLANVTIPIRDGGIGEVVYAIDGTRRCSGARSVTGRGVDKGEEVVIVRYDKGIAYVSTIDDFPKSMEAPQ